MKERINLFWTVHFFVLIFIKIYTRYLYAHTVTHDNLKKTFELKKLAFEYQTFDFEISTKLQKYNQNVIACFSSRNDKLNIWTSYVSAILAKVFGSYSALSHTLIFD